MEIVNRSVSESCPSSLNYAVSLYPNATPLLPGTRLPEAVFTNASSHLSLAKINFWPISAGEKVMVWRKTWAEREIAHGKDCEAEVLSASSSKKYKIKYTIDGSSYEGTCVLAWGSTFHWSPPLSARADILIKVWNHDMGKLSPSLGILLICFDTESYRRLCWSQPQESDFVVEIGSSYGKATEIIAKRKTKGLVRAKSRKKKNALLADVSLFPFYNLYFSF